MQGLFYFWKGVQHAKNNTKMAGIPGFGCSPHSMHHSCGIGSRGIFTWGRNAGSLNQKSFWPLRPLSGRSSPVSTSAQTRYSCNSSTITSAFLRSWYPTYFQVYEEIAAAMAAHLDIPSFSWVANTAPIWEQTDCVELGSGASGRGGGCSFAGDIIFFDYDHNGSANHVGIVESCDGSTVYTIEGNASDAVKRLSYSANYGGIAGYGSSIWPRNCVEMIVNRSQQRTKKGEMVLL